MGLHKWELPQNSWLIIEDPIKMIKKKHFRETSISLLVLNQNLSWRRPNGAVLTALAQSERIEAINGRGPWPWQMPKHYVGQHWICFTRQKYAKMQAGGDEVVDVTVALAALVYTAGCTWLHHDHLRSKGRAESWSGAPAAVATMSCVMDTFCFLCRSCCDLS